jgi:DNA helicase-2/ATP-dependent DNA helicase PcrA
MAVPGSGKTASVTERTKNLVAKGVDPKAILCITFTNKAAAEMRQRIGAAVGTDKAALMTISTFHSLCSRIIRANAAYLGLTQGYSIYDDDDQERLLKSCIRRVEDPTDIGKFKPSKQYVRQLMGYIEGKRNACMAEQEALDKFGLDGNQAKVAALYFTELKRANAVDFTGLLSETLRLLTEHPDIRDKYRSRFKYVAVDEVQDTNVAQYEFVKALGMGHKNVLVVGDLDQSIYKFRSACPENILKFEKDFSPCTVLMLEKNYRSTPSILRHSQKLIEHNTLRKGTSLVTDNVDGEPPQIVASKSDYDMAERIAQEAERQIALGVKPKEIAVLYRTNYASRVLEQALRDRRLQYRIIGGLSFWDRKEIKWSLAILKLMCNPTDRMSFEKTVEACCRGVGEKTIGHIADNASLGKVSVMKAAHDFLQSGTKAGANLKPLLGALEHSKGVSPGQALMKIAHDTALWTRLESDSTDTNDRCGNVSEMARDVDSYCSRPNCTLSGYLQNISLLTSADDDKDEEKLIKLMTLHGCKGLEFDVVMISHCNEELLPHARIATEAKDPAEYEAAVEEERRLLYVGMTRARKRLFLHWNKTKSDGRSEKPIPVRPSKFLWETNIPCDDLEEYQDDPPEE